MYGLQNIRPTIVSTRRSPNHIAVDGRWVQQIVFKRMNKAVICLQHWWRLQICRRKFKELVALDSRRKRLKELEEKCKLQKKLEEKRIKALRFKVERRAALRIQSVYRNYMYEKARIELVLKMEREAEQICKSIESATIQSKLHQKQKHRSIVTVSKLCWKEFTRVKGCCKGGAQNSRCKL